MKQVNFFDNRLFNEKAEKTFIIEKNKIKKLLPEADVQHVGSTAVPDSITKGDLDIQVRVFSKQFHTAVQELSSLYDINEGSIKTDTFRAFKDDATIPPLGVQLTVIDSEFDFFWKFRDVLMLNNRYQNEYDELKRKYEGKEMDEYREAKNVFFRKIMETPEFKNCGK